MYRTLPVYLSLESGRGYLISTTLAPAVPELSELLLDLASEPILQLLERSVRLVAWRVVLELPSQRDFWCELELE